MGNKEDIGADVRTGLRQDLALLLIQRLDVIQARHNAEIDAIKAELAAMLPDWAGQARYQKLRLICSDRRKMRALRDGMIKV